MFAYKEYLLIASCPYCGKDFSTVIGNANEKFIHRCRDCSRGLTVIAAWPIAIVEPGTQKSVTVSLEALTKDCCQ
jgi:hypothetical protein